MSEHNDFKKALESLVTCTICCDVLKDPKTLPCLHTLCLKCIKDWNQTCKTNNKPFSCPSCIATIHLPEGDVAKLPASFHHNSLIQLYQTYQNKASDNQQHSAQDCSFCSSRCAPVGFCFQCEGLVCDECYNFHKVKKKLNDTHQAMLWSEFCKENIDNYIDHMALCKEKFHEKYRLEYYCETCKKTVCQKCTATVHSSHAKVSIEEKHGRATKVIRDEKHRMLKVAEMHKKELKMCDENRKKFQNEIKEAKIKVQNDIQAKIAILQDKQHTLISELEETLQKKTNDNDEEREQISNAIQHAVKLADQCEKIENSHLKQVFLDGHENLVDVCKTTVKGNPILTTRPDQSRVSVRYIPNKNATKVLKNLKLGELEKPLPSDKYQQFSSYIIPSLFVVLLSIATVMWWPQHATKYNFIATPVKVFNTETSYPKSLAVNNKGEFVVFSDSSMKDKAMIRLYNTKGEYWKKIEVGRISGNGVAYTSNWCIVANAECGHSIACLNKYYVNSLIRDTQSIRISTRNIDEYSIAGLTATNQAIVCLYFSKASEKRTTKVMVVDKETLKPITNVILDVPDDIRGEPQYIALANNKYFVTFDAAHKIFVFGENGQLFYTIGKAGKKPGQLQYPQGLVPFGTDMLLICDFSNRVQLFNQNGVFITAFGSYGSGLGQLMFPVDVAVGPDGQIFVLDFNSKIQVFQIQQK